jgi:hypothetical protein
MLSSSCDFISPVQGELIVIGNVFPGRRASRLPWAIAMRAFGALPLGLFEELNL